MFKKFTALLMLTAFTNVYAITPIQQTNALANELNKTFDSLNYQLNVEWDQKDVQHFDATMADFENEIASLQEQGLTNEDLIKYTTGKIKDKLVLEEIASLSNLIDNSEMSDVEARDFVVSKLSSTYNHGASWSGSRLGGHTAFIIGLIILICVCSKKKHTETPKKEHCRPNPCQYGYSSNSYNNGCYDFQVTSYCGPY